MLLNMKKTRLGRIGIVAVLIMMIITLLSPSIASAYRTAGYTETRWRGWTGNDYICSGAHTWSVGFTSLVMEQTVKTKE